MDKIYINNKPFILTESFDKELLTDISWSTKNLNTHDDIAHELKNKSPYLVTILMTV